MRKQRKGQVAQIGIVIMAAAIALMFGFNILQSKTYEQKIYTEEINVLEARDALFMTEKGMDASWKFASVQSLFRAGDTGIGIPLWYYLDNKKPVNNPTQTGVTESITKTEKGAGMNPEIQSRNPLVFKPNADAFSRFFSFVLSSIYLPKGAIEYYLKGTRAIIGSVASDEVSLEDALLRSIVTQDIVTAGKNIEFRKVHASTAEIPTQMKIMIEKAHQFVDISREFVSKTATFEQGCTNEYCLQPVEKNGKSAPEWNSVSAVDMQNQAQAWLKMKTDDFAKSLPSDVMQAEADAGVSGVITGSADDKLIGNQAGLEMAFGSSLVLTDKKNIYPFDMQNAVFNVYEKKDMADKSQPINPQSSNQENEQKTNDTFRLRPISLQFNTAGKPVILDCKKHNDEEFAYNEPEDILCMNNMLYSCDTDIQGLTNKKKSGASVSYGTGVYKCITASGKKQWCRQATETREEEFCCTNWKSGSIFASGKSYCIGDGSCDNGQDNLDKQGGDRGERCSYNGNANPDCPCSSGCCDPDETAGDKNGCVPVGHKKSGTDCLVCAGGQYRDDDSLCKKNEQCILYYDYDDFGFWTPVYGRQDYFCSSGECVPGPCI